MGTFRYDGSSRCWIAPSGRPCPLREYIRTNCERTLVTWLTALLHGTYPRGVIRALAAIQEASFNLEHITPCARRRDDAACYQGGAYMPAVVPVKFSYAARGLWFDWSDSGAQEGDHVILRTERGQEIGLVIDDVRDVTDDERQIPLGGCRA